MFRKRQKFNSASASRIFENRLKFAEDGTCSFVLADCSAQLPDRSKFNLSDMLKAGVNLQQLNTRLFDFASADLPDAVQDEFKETENSSKENA